jgi:Acyclic terpene utilisation family protein AtuA
LNSYLLMMKQQIRIAAGQGFWGDLPDAPVRQVEGGPIDYLMLDYLAEVTMSIMQKQRSRDPSAGYAKDFVPLMKQILPACVERDIRVTANAGGVNVEGCANAVKEVARELGLSGKLKIGIVTGDDILPRIDELLARGVAMRNMDTGATLDTVRDRIQSANVYLGAAPMVEALNRGARIVITGRATDTGLTLAPLIHEFGWGIDDWNKLAAGTIAGHIIECGAQCSGGNCQYEWRSIPNLADVGFPIVEASPDGSFVITKHERTGGWVIIPSIKEQLVYEMGDPHEYITPDCVADFTTVQLEYEGRDRVRVFGVEGRPATDTFKVSISYSAGYKAVGTLVYSWPDAYDKAQAADRILRGRLDRLGLKFDEILTEFVGASATHGPLAGKPSPDLPEVQLRAGVRSQNRADVERFTKEIAPLVLTGPPGVTGFAGGRPKVEEIVAYWPALIPKQEILPKVEVINV